ncbi:hypothetical protein CDAR_375421, partial [Caerostris darwini]
RSSPNTPRTLTLVPRSIPTSHQRPSSWFNYRSGSDLTNQNFSTFADKFNPHLYEGANYTALMRWNMSDPTRITIKPKWPEVLKIEISATAIGRTPTPAPPTPRIVVLLHDGACSSTCAVASGALHLQGV